MEIKDIYNRLGEGKSNKLFIDGATHYLANCIKENSGAMKYHCSRITSITDGLYENTCAYLLYSAFMETLRGVLQLSIVQDMPIEEQIADILKEYHNNNESTKIKPYRILHKDTGLYYKPCGETGNLSRIGKIYSSPNNILNQYGRKNYVFIRLLGKNKNRIAEIHGNKIYESSTEIQFEIPKSEFEIQYLE